MARAQVVVGDDGDALRGEGLANMAADVTGATGHQDGHGYCIPRSEGVRRYVGSGSPRRKTKTDEAIIPRPLEPCGHSVEMQGGAIAPISIRAVGGMTATLQRCFAAL
jgi:hypothetical protein